jgi:hypothetical protein
LHHAGIIGPAGARKKSKALGVYGAASAAGLPLTEAIMADTVDERI